MSERETSFLAADGVSRLRGSVLIPSGAATPAPAALLVVGSGPLDRDSNLKRQRLQATKALAHALADVGIASLRFDKRGAGQSDGDFKATGFSDNIDDAELALAHLRSLPEIDAARTVVIGHSAGAVIATELAVRVADLAGVGLLAGAAGKGREVLVWQAGMIADSLPTPVKLVMRLLRTDLQRMQAKRLAKLDRTTGDTARMQGVKINARWFREYMAFDPSARLKQIEMPVLAITGEADVQVPPGDVAVTEGLVGGPFEGHVPRDLSHIFRLDPERRGVQGYKKALKEPVDPELLELVAGWAQRTLSVEQVF